MDYNLKDITDSDICYLFLQVKQELKSRNISLKENKIKERITLKSHDVKSSINKIANQKSTAVDGNARIVTSSIKK